MKRVYQAPEMICQQILCEDIVTASVFGFKDEGGVANKYGFEILKPQ